MKITVLDGYTMNPGDNPWDALASLGELTVYDRTPPELVLSRAMDAEILLTNKTHLSRETSLMLPLRRNSVFPLQMFLLTVQLLLPSSRLP